MKKLSLKDRVSLPLAAEPAADSVTKRNDLTTPRSGPGAMMAFMAKESEVFSENQKLTADLAKTKAQLDEFGHDLPVRKLDPTLITRSRWSNRHEHSFTDEEFAALKADIAAAGGNVQPIKVRPMKEIAEGQSAKYEVVFGHRRHQACLELGILVLTMIGDVGEQELFIEMDRENRQRKDLRPFEKGVMYKKALDEGLFSSARKLADAAGVDLTTLGRELVLARLPIDVLGAFESPLDLQQRWATDLGEALKSNPDAVLARAKELQKETPRLPAKQVLKQLTEGGRLNLPPSPKSIPKTIPLTGVAGQSASIVVNAKKKSASIDIQNVDPSRIGELQKAIQKFIS